MTQHSFGRAKDHLASSVDYINNIDELPFRDVLESASFLNEIEAANVNCRERVYPVTTTLLAFVAQALCPDGSCRQAVARVNADRIAHGLRPASPLTSSYCEARERLPEALPRKLVETSGQQLEADLPGGWLWQGRHVKLIDGTTVSMPDTEENQVDYPQNVSQKPGLGFPIARLVAVLSLASGAVLDFATGPYAGKATGEHALLRQLLGSFQSNDIAVGDAYYCSYFLFAMLLALGVDAAFRIKGGKLYDFRKGKRLGKSDHLVMWRKGPKPEWMTDDDYAEMPETLELRELKLTVEVPGFRTKSFVVVTTLKSAALYSKEQISDVYRRRWSIEVDLRTIKGIMRMDILRCLTPSMVRKEMAVHFLAYNLIRKAMAEAAFVYACYPRELSFKATVQTLNAYRFVWIYNEQIEGRLVYAQLLYAISRNRVGRRPNRVEPRKLKRRPKRTKYLMHPRQQKRDTLHRATA